MLGNINPEGKQTEVLALPPHGHTVVLGTAGSGKTTMALLRALGLSNMPNSPNVLVVTFNGALVQYMERILASHSFYGYIITTLITATMRAIIISCPDNIFIARSIF